MNKLNDRNDHQDSEGFIVGGQEESPMHQGEDVSLIDQFHSRLSLRDQLESTKNILNFSSCRDEQHQIELNDFMGIEYMQNNVMVLNIQNKLFYTTRRTLMGEALQSSDRPSSNFGTLTENIQKELDKDIGIFSNSDSEKLEYIQAGVNLFQLMKDQLKIYDGTEESINTHFKDRNPIGFEFVLEHLRFGGKVKCIGIEKMNLNMLKCILKESTYFQTEKLTYHVQLLMKTHHRSEVLEFESMHDTLMNPKKCLSSIEKTLNQVEDQLKMKDQVIQQLSTEIAKKFKSFLVDKNKQDEFYECEDLVIMLNVSGLKFNIPFRVLAQFDNFIMTKYIQSPNFKVGPDEHIFFDRNPEMFSLIYSYMMCGGKFNHFPSSMPIEKKVQLKREAEFYGLKTLIDEYLDELRYPIEMLSCENIQIKDRDDWIRKFFVKHRDSPILNDKYLTLSPLFEKIDEINSRERFKIDFVKCPKLLDLTNKLKYSRHIEKPELVNNLETFKKNWFEFSQGLLEGVDWNGLFAAGGGVLGCLFKGDKTNMDQNTLITEHLPNNCQEETEVLESKNIPFKVNQNDFMYGKSNSQNNNASTQNYYHRFYCVSNGYGALGHNLHFSGLEWVRKQALVRTEYHKRYVKKATTKKDVPSATMKMDTSQARYIPEPNIPTSFQKSDIDLYLYAVSEEEAEEKIKHIYQTIKTNLRKRLVREFPTFDKDLSTQTITSSNDHKIIEPEEIVDDDVIIIRTQHAVTFYGYKTRPIQVVLRIYKSPAEVLLSFDIDAASVGFDGSTVWTTDRCRRSLAHRANLVDVDRQSTTYEYRLYKYAKRGFAVSVPGYHHSKVKNELLHYPRVHLFSKIQKNLRGLARILMFEFACTSKNPRHILASYDDPNGANAHLNEEKWSNDFIFDPNTKPSDYFNITLIKTNRFRPKKIYESIQKARKVYNEVLAHVYMNRHFICTFNDIETNFRYENEPSCKNVPSYIKFITIEPGSQTPIGSFHPTTDNFFKVAYTKFNQAELSSTIGDTVIWLKSAFGDKSNEGDSNFWKVDYTKEYTISKYVLVESYEDSWFESFSPQLSAKIEHSFRLFLSFRTNIECQLNDHEIVNFENWSVRYGPSHPQFPNQSSMLYRKTVLSNNVEEDDEAKSIPKSLSSYSYF